MAKKLIQACAVFIVVTAIIYGNKPIQQPEESFGRRRNPIYYQTPGLGVGRGGGMGTF